VNELLRTQRANLERDPAGQPILRAELVSFDPTDAALDRARAAGFQVVRERVLEGLDSRVVVLRAPEGMTTRRALRRLRALDPQGAYDYNHVYLDSGVIAPTIAASDAPVFAPGGVPSVSTKGAVANRPKQSASGMLRLAALAPDASDAAGAPTAGRFRSVSSTAGSMCRTRFSRQLRFISTGATASLCRLHTVPPWRRFSSARPIRSPALRRAPSCLRQTCIAGSARAALRTPSSTPSPGSLVSTLRSST
jgi:hypothetical protein